MKIKSFLLLFFLSYLLSIPVYSQGEIDDEKKIFFRNEKSWAIFLNTNGFGGNFRKGTRINAFRKFLWEVDMNYVKDAKEIKISNRATQLNQYVYGKLNFAWETRGGAGFQHQLFRKIDKSGVEVRFFYVGGPNIVLLKPIYYEVIVGDETEDQKFDPNMSPNIYGRASFFKGFGEMGFAPGGYIKGGLSFEYSKNDRRLQALEIGGTVSGFLLPVEIMYGHKTNFLYSLFISFRWGKIIRGGRMEGVELEGEGEF